MAKVKRTIPKERPSNPSIFTVADRTKLTSIEFGANISGFPTIEEENISVSLNEDVFNFSGHVEVTDQGFQTDIVIPLDLDGGTF